VNHVFLKTKKFVDFQHIAITYGIEGLSLIDCHYATWNIVSITEPNGLAHVDQHLLNIPGTRKTFLGSAENEIPSYFETIVKGP
jgi:hypothetical protein